MRRTISRQGSALIIVLALLALVVVLVLATFSVSRDHAIRETIVADGMETESLTRLPANIVMTQLQRSTTQPDLLWTSQPGMIRTFGSTIAAGKTKPAALMHYRLYSAPVMNSPTFDVASEAAATSAWASQPATFTDLNEPALNGQSEAVYPIADPVTLGVMDGCDLRAPAPGADARHPLPLPVAWMYVLKDGQLVMPKFADADGAHFDEATVTAQNPIVARIAFWTDDESCKLNLNTASEPRPWSMPAANTLTERGYAEQAPEPAEFFADSAHPAFTSLSVVMKHFGGGHTGSVQWPVVEPVDPLNAETCVWRNKHLACYQTLVPCGMMTATTFKQERHFASVDEFYFASDRSPNGQGVGFAMTERDLRQARFLLTTHSCASDLNPFGQPKLALWTMPKDSAQRTLTDRRIQTCTSLDATHEFIFQRASDWSRDASLGSSQSMSADWSEVPRNQALFAWMQRMSETAMPGIGSRFVDKYGTASRDHLLVSMFDMLRWTCNPSLPAAGSIGEQSAVPLTIERATDSLRGYGRHPTFSEVAVVFAFTDVERVNGKPRDDNNDGICDRATKLRAFMVVNPFMPAAGPPAMSPAWSLRIRRLQQWSIGKGIGPQLPGGNVRTRAQLSTTAPINGGASTAFGNFAALFLKSDGTPKEINNRVDPANGFPFISQNDVSLPASDGKPDSKLAFSGGRIIVDVMPVDSPLAQPKPGDAIHSVEIEFPKVDMPMPSLRVSDYQTGPRKLTQRFTPVQDGKVWRLPLIERGDIVRSMIINKDGPCKGDARLIAARRELFFPEAANWFRPHPDYFSTHPQAQSLRDGGLMLEPQFGSLGDDGHAQPTRDTAGTLLTNVSVASNAIAAVPLGLNGTQQLDGTAGDWESGIGLREDGAMVSRGNTASGSFTRGVTTAQSSKALPLTSAIGFGALPSGAFGDAQSPTPLPWQTLQFYPKTNTTASPPDHLWLEFFTHPITEPWPMTANFAAEGKVNMNYQVLPWTWLRRATAMHGALEGVRLTAIPTTALTAENNSSKGRNDGSHVAQEFRYAINASATLAAFEQRFDANEVFRTPSEICEMSFVPKRLTGHDYGDAADPANLSANDMPQWWKGSGNDGFAATGDNLRESPYAQLYPRLCTQSNVYRVHYRVQTLKKARSTLPASFDESRDSVVGERRGSCVIERQFAPADATLDPVTDNTAPSLHTQQRVVIVSHERFAP